MGEQQAMAAKTAQGKDNPEGKSDRKTLSKAPTLGVLSRAVYGRISEAYLKHQCTKFKDLDSQTQGEILEGLIKEQQAADQANTNKEAKACKLQTLTPEEFIAWVQLRWTLARRSGHHTPHKPMSGMAQEE
jgi:hypothetical protein